VVDLPRIEPATLQRLLERGERYWNEFQVQMGQRHHLFVPCDQVETYAVLRELREHASSFLEFGSAAGVVTIMADLLGYEAWGIEIEPVLVQQSIRLAEDFGSQAEFAEGSFVPLAYRDEIAQLSADRVTPTAGACALDELGIDLQDPDVIFAYPWPGEEDWLHEMMRRHARMDTTLLTYDATEGCRADRVCDL